jgi:hypothetical protein
VLSAHEEYVDTGLSAHDDDPVRVVKRQRQQTVNLPATAFGGSSPSPRTIDIKDNVQSDPSSGVEHEASTLWSGVRISWVALNTVRFLSSADRAVAYEATGLAFESLRKHHHSSESPETSMFPGFPACVITMFC